jgi:hypothetical protein
MDSRRHAGAWREHILPKLPSTAALRGSDRWMTKGSEFELMERQECSLLHIVPTGSGDKPASYPMGIWGSWAGGGGKAAGPLI